MSDFFRNLAGQGASSSRSNAQSWADELETPEAKALLAKGDSGAELTQAEQNNYAAYKHWLGKNKEAGIEPTKAVSSSTGVPDFADRAAQASKMSQALQSVSGRGRRQSMMNGEYGDSMLGGF
jgi:hypothetical protein